MYIWLYTEKAVAPYLMVELKYGDFLTRGLKTTLDVLYIARCYHFFIVLEQMLKIIIFY